MGVKIPFSFSSKQNGYSATDQINVMKLRLPTCNLIAVNHDVIEESNRVVSPRPENLCFAINWFITINIILWQQQVCCALFDGWSY